jgi:hypothetical protein
MLVAGVGQALAVKAGIVLGFEDDLRIIQSFTSYVFSYSSYFVCSFDLSVPHIR